MHSLKIKSTNEKKVVNVLVARMHHEIFPFPSEEFHIHSKIRD